MRKTGSLITISIITLVIVITEWYILASKQDQTLTGTILLGTIVMGLAIWLAVRRRVVDPLE